MLVTSHLTPISVSFDVKFEFNRASRFGDVKQSVTDKWTAACPITPLSPPFLVGFKVS